MSDEKFTGVFPTDPGAALEFTTSTDPGDEVVPVESAVEKSEYQVKLEELSTKVTDLKGDRDISDIGLSDPYHGAVAELQKHYHENK